MSRAKRIKKAKGMTRKLNRFYSALSHKFDQCVLLAKLLVKVVYLALKAFYLRTQLCYKGVLLRWYCFAYYVWLS